MATVPAPEVLTRSQHARRARVIEAAIELAREGGYDAVQMRDVSARGKVALGTVYRYFSSKDHLLAAALLEWTQSIEAAPIARAASRRGAPVDRLVAVIRRLTEATAQDPVLFAAFVTAITRPDSAVLESQNQIQDLISTVLSLPLEEVDPELRAGVVRVLTHVWFSALLRWVNGWFAIEQVTEELEFAARLLLRNE